MREKFEFLEKEYCMKNRCYEIMLNLLFLRIKKLSTVYENLYFNFFFL